MLPPMSNSDSLSRSLELMSAGDTTLLVVDVQEKLVRLIPGARRIIWNVGRLIQGAKILRVPVLATEQYPKGLGPTTPELAALLGTVPGKIGFSCLSCDEIAARLAADDRPKVLLAGIEAHVCIQQTALDLLASGRSVYVAVDAIGSRYAIDEKIAIAADAVERGHVDHDRGRPVRVVPGGRHAGIQADQRPGARPGSRGKLISSTRDSRSSKRKLVLCHQRAI